MKASYDPDKRHRRSVRLQGFDYSREGAYFVTVCAQNRACLFGDVDQEEMRLNDAGRLVRAVLNGLPDHYPHVALDAWVIMPNHVHGIVLLVGAGFKPAPTATADTTRHGLSEIVRAFKTFSARQINAIHGTPGTSVWQRNYYEHIIRDDASLNRIRQYIMENPPRWSEDPENPACMRPNVGDDHAMAIGPGLKPGPTVFGLPFGLYHVLRGDSFTTPCSTLVLHGAGKSSRATFSELRHSLNGRGIPTASFDFIGHGETGGDLIGCTLQGRTEQAAAVIRHTCMEPLTLIASSMSGYTAIKLTELFGVNNLILLVPAVYTPRAYCLPFGPEFSAAIRVPGSWKDSDAFDILSGFKGNLLIIAAESDNVIPVEVIEQLHASAKNTRVRRLHVVPGSGHLNLFPSEQDFLLAIEMIVDVCRG
jgi:putative transposase